MLVLVVFLLMKKKSLNLNSAIKVTTLLLNFYFASISNEFSVTGSREVSLNGNVYDFCVD